MRRALPALAVLVCLGCLPEEATDPTPRQSGGDAAVVDAGLDAGDAATVDMGSDPDLGPPQPCTWPADCPEGDCVGGVCTDAVPLTCRFEDACADDGSCPAGQACEDGTCRGVCPEGEICGGFAGNGWCYEPCELAETCPARTRPCAGNVECPVTMVCVTGRCINACVHDGECPAEGYCYEGECRPYPDELTGEAPAPLGQPDQLFAGVGVVPLDFPLGVSMAGFGGRPGPRNPYAVALGGSDRVFERQDVRVIALSTDEEVLILLRLPLSWSTDYLLTRTAVKVQAATGIDYSSKIVTFATHSHSQPGRYWNLVPATGFGVFGYGQFSNEMVERYSDSFAEAILAALGDMKPAAVGWHMIDSFDPQRRIHSNRRGEFPEYTDDRMLVMRVDEADGTPMAAVVNFAIHGTHMELPWVTGDVAGGIEVVATEALSAEVGHYVPVLFANGNAGNISPRGDDNTRVNWGKMQVVGHRVWPIFKGAWDAALGTLNADPHLEVVQRRIPLSYELLGYDGGVPEFQARDGSPQKYGAFQCVANGRGRDEPPHMDGALACIINLRDYLGQPTVQLHKSVLSALRIDDLVVTSLPGEPSSQLGLELSEGIEADARAAGLEEVRVMNFGYAQDHHLYLVLEEDWFRGGYEAAQGLWGWRLGRYFLEHSRALAGQLFTDAVEDNSSRIKPTIWPDIPDDTVPPTVGAVEPGTLVADVADTARRGDLIELRWVGGHPGVDQPDVVMEIADAEGVFAPLMRHNMPFDHRGFETLTFYLGDFEGDHVWAVRWELPWDLPLGEYRIRVRGAAWDGAEARPFDTHSAAFTLEPARLVAREVTVEGEVLAAKINYPDGPTNDDGETPFEALEIQGHWLRFDAEASLGSDALKSWSFVLGPAAPVDGLTAHAAEVPLELVAAPDLVDRTLVTARPADGEPVRLALTGWLSTRVELPAPAAGPVRISDAWGNYVDVPLE